MNVDEILHACAVMPVIVLERVEHAVPLARTLVENGIRVIEVTLRTPAALDCVHAIRQDVPEAIVGLGTITRAEDVKAAVAAGAHFGVSPGSTDELLVAIAASGLPFLPGVMTPSDVMRTLDAGFKAMKLFPASQAGGIGMLRALRGPFAQVRFCPTGGIDANDAALFLAEPNVACVGGSWVAPARLIHAQAWQAIGALARTAAAMAVHA